MGLLRCRVITLPQVVMFTSPLDNIHVANPCPADWNKMTGDDRIRHCSDCEQNVFNLTDLTTKEALRLIRDTQGRLCVRFYRRADGTILTRDCPGVVNIPKERRNAILYAFAFAGLLIASNPINMAVWNVAKSAVESVTHGNDIDQIAGMMLPPDDMFVEMTMGEAVMVDDGIEQGVQLPIVEIE